MQREITDFIYVCSTLDMKICTRIDLCTSRKRGVFSRVQNIDIRVFDFGVLPVLSQIVAIPLKFLTVARQLTNFFPPPRRRVL